MPLKKTTLSQQELAELHNNLLGALLQGRPFGEEGHLRRFREGILVLKRAGLLWRFFKTRHKRFGSVFAAAASQGRYFELECLLKELSALSLKKRAKPTLNQIRSLLMRKNAQGMTCLDYLIQPGARESGILKQLLGLLSPEGIAKLLYSAIFNKNEQTIKALLQNTPKDKRFSVLVTRAHSQYPSHLFALQAFELTHLSELFFQGFIDAGLCQDILSYLRLKDARGRTFLHYASKYHNPAFFQSLLRFYEPSDLQEVDGDGKTPIELLVRSADPIKLMYALQHGVKLDEDSPLCKVLPEIVAEAFHGFLEQYRARDNMPEERKNRLEHHLKSAVTALEILSHTGIFLGRFIADPDGYLQKMLIVIESDQYKRLLGDSRIGNMFLYACRIGRKPGGFFLASKDRKNSRTCSQFLGWYSNEEPDYTEENDRILARFMRYVSFWRRSDDPYHAQLLVYLEQHIVHYFAGVENGVVLGMRSSQVAMMRTLALKFFAGQSLSKLLWFQMAVHPLDNGDVETVSFLRREIEGGLAMPLDVRQETDLDKLIKTNRILLANGKHWNMNFTLLMRTTAFVVLSLSFGVIALITNLFNLNPAEEEYRTVSPGMLNTINTLIALIFSAQTILFLRHAIEERREKTRFWRGTQDNIEAVKTLYEKLPPEHQTLDEDTLKSLVVDRKSFRKANDALASAFQTLRFMYPKRAVFESVEPPEHHIINMP